MNAGKRLSTRPCARSMIQIFYSSFILFLFYIVIWRFIEAVRSMLCPTFILDSFFHYFKTQRAVKELHLEKDDKSEIILKTYSKSPNQIRSWVVFIGIQIGLFYLLIFHKVSFSRCPFRFCEVLMQFDKVFLSRCMAWLSVAFWEPWPTDFYHYRRRNS